MNHHYTEWMKGTKFTKKTDTKRTNVKHTQTQSSHRDLRIVVGIRVH